MEVDPCVAMIGTVAMIGAVDRMREGSPDPDELGARMKGDEAGMRA